MKRGYSKQKFIDRWDLVIYFSNMLSIPLTDALLQDSNSKYSGTCGVKDSFRVDCLPDKNIFSVVSLYL